MRIRLLIFYVMLIFGFLFPVTLFASTGSISPTSHISWLCTSEPGNSDCHDHTRVNWYLSNPLMAKVEIGDTNLTGWIFSEQMGWIHLNPTTSGVHIDINGHLSGYAWATAGSWVNFSPTHGGVSIDTGSGNLSGWAWVENFGWMKFDCSTPDDPDSACVNTTWRPPGSDVGVPVASSTSGTYASSTTVTLSSVNSSSIRYNVGPTGSVLDPTCTEGSVFDSASPIIIATSSTIKAIGCAGGFASSIATFDYVITNPIVVENPIADNPSDTYTSSTTVTLSSVNSLSIHYNVGQTGSVLDPTCTEGSVFDSASPIIITTSSTIKAIGCNGIYFSNVSTFDYTINIPAPVIVVSDPTASPLPGTYTSTTTVSLYTNDSLNTIHYTNDGSIPSCSSGTVYSSPINILSSETIKAIACQGTSSSNVVSFAYLINIAGPGLEATSTMIYTPQSSLSSGVYTSKQTITLFSQNSSSIHYTNNGIIPTCFSGTNYTGGILVATSETIKAIGCKDGLFSAVGIFNYTIEIPQPTVVTAITEVAKTQITNVTNSVKSTVTFAQKAFADPGNVSKIQAITTTGVVVGSAVSAASGILFSSFSLADLLLVPIRLWSLLLGAFGLAKRKKPWGTVYDSVTKQPLDPAYVVLKSMEGEDVATAITDLDGRYGFVAPKEGNYSLFVHKTNYVFPSQKLVGQDHDELYRDLYFGEHFTVTTLGEVVAKNIPMDPEKFDWNEFAKKSQHLMRFYSVREKWLSIVSEFFFIVGFTVSTVAFAFSVTKSNVLIFLLYVVLFFIRRFGLKSRPYGSIMSKETGKPIAFAIIRISQESTGVEIMHRVSDQIGRYYCLLPNGNYLIRIDQKLSDGSYKQIADKIPAKVLKGYLSEKFVVADILIDAPKIESKTASV